MRSRSFRVSPLRLALLTELVEGLAYECGSGDWPMQEAEATVRERIRALRYHYGDVETTGRDALKEHITESVALERTKLLTALAKHNEKWLGPGVVEAFLEDYK